MKSKLYLLLLTAIIMSCGGKPKVIEAQNMEGGDDQANTMTSSAEETHKAVCQEILHTDKYTYMRVDENGEEKWIAAPYNPEVKEGETYYYKGGLKKNNFKSTEYDRVFETIYLVSGISRDPAMSPWVTGNPHQHLSNTQPTGATVSTEPPPGTIKLADLFANRDKYNGQKVKVHGRVVKVNNMIMNRNWIHLQDGSLKSDESDLTITTTELVPVGSTVAFEGMIALNKDFGAGYRYEIIMEDAQLIR